MTNAIQGANVNKAGTCPHGASPGACPICSGMGGGGLRPGERVQKPGEMSYHECAMIGAMMRAREAQQKLHEQTLLNHVEALRAFEQTIINATKKIADLGAKLNNNFLTKPLAFVVNNLALPLLRAVSNLPSIILNIADKISQIKEKFVDIQDKLNAIFGEAKAFVEKKISELISSIKLKFVNLYRIFKRNNTKDDETKIDEDKKIFRLKSFINKILGRKKDDTEDKSGS